MNEVDNSALTFENGNYAQCPVCEEKVAWTALTGDAALTLPAGGHYYLADDVTYAGAETVGVADGTGVANVQVFNRSFNLYGGKVFGGDGPQIMTNNWSSTATGAASILLSVIGEFTFSNDNAADYVSCFVAPDGYKIKENENVLTCVAQ